MRPEEQAAEVLFRQGPAASLRDGLGRGAEALAEPECGPRPPSAGAVTVDEEASTQPTRRWTVAAAA